MELQLGKTNFHNINDFRSCTFKKFEETYKGLVTWPIIEGWEKIQQLLKRIDKLNEIAEKEIPETNENAMSKIAKPVPNKKLKTKLSTK